MKWFKKKRNTYKHPIDIDAHIRELLFDCQFPEANQIAILLGSPSISDEIIEKEEEESDRRVEPLNHLFPILDSYATLVAEGVVALQKLDPDVNDLPERFWNITTRLLKMVSFSVLVGTLSQLNEMNLIEVIDDAND